MVILRELYTCDSISHQHLIAICNSLDFAIDEMYFCALFPNPSFNSILFDRLLCFSSAPIID